LKIKLGVTPVVEFEPGSLIVSSWKAMKLRVYDRENDTFEFISAEPMLFLREVDESFIEVFYKNKVCLCKKSEVQMLEYKQQT
jgi:hypothetical protein